MQNLSPLYKLRLAPFSIFVMLWLFGCAQTRQTTATAQAFVTERMPGNIIADENGEAAAGSGPRLIYSVFLETQLQQTPWDSIRINGSVYGLTTQLIEQDDLDLGTNKLSQKPVILRRKPGTHLWKMEAAPIPVMPNTARPALAETVILLGEDNGKKMERKISPVIELSVPEAY